VLRMMWYTLWYVWARVKCGKLPTGKMRNRGAEQRVELGIIPHLPVAGMFWPVMDRLRGIGTNLGISMGKLVNLGLSGK